MKRLIIITVGIALGFVFFSAHAKGREGGAKKDANAGTMNIQVREVIVRATPNYLGAQAGTLNYGNSVKVVGDEGNWYKIDKPAGFIPKSAVTKHKVAANPDEKFAGKGQKHDEVALAGKGFNPQVEAQYKKDNASIAAAYASVDQVENFSATEAELKEFQAAGKLTPR